LADDRDDFDPEPLVPPHAFLCEIHGKLFRKPAGCPWCRYEKVGGRLPLDPLPERERDPSRAGRSKSDPILIEHAKRLRKERSWTYAQIAAELGIGETTVWEWLRKRPPSKPSAKTLSRSPSTSRA
jgi:hypothetical protein